MQIERLREYSRIYNVKYQYPFSPYNPSTPCTE